jgi:hypothetical protein
VEDPVTNDMERPLGDDFGLETWQPQRPSPEFADQLMTRLRAECPASRPRRPNRLLLGTYAVAIAAAIALFVGTRPSKGEATASERTEIAVGRRALAVLEPGASIRWSGDDVTQERGDVFYRVEPGAKFKVHTPAGDVEVKGTCFAVKNRTAGASALAFVAVYEGKVAVTHESDHLDLTAGETARTGPDGVKRTDGDTDLDTAIDRDGPLGQANQNLARQVSDYRSRLESVSAEKTALEAKLKKSEAILAAAQDGAIAVPHHDFDLSPDDWKELAKSGIVKFQMPCMNIKENPWTPSSKVLDELGLAPQDAATIRSVYARSNQRMWAALKPLCAQAIGSTDIAERIGPDTCIHLVLDIESERSRDQAMTARRQAAEIRAGLRPEPAPSDAMHPVLKLFLVTTAETKLFEADLAQSFGPEEAHRLVYSDTLCMGRNTFGSATPSK